jgi:hypothetical protein
MSDLSLEKTSKYGCWSFQEGMYYDNKYQALLNAKNNPTTTYIFYYHDHIWKNYDLTTLGRTPLRDLYKQRAQQLRNRYDYLVLHYSGGSDSHNILQTFIRNNIKLDEITVRWAKPLMDGKFYNPNNTDVSANNSPSEWDYVIKPELEKLRISNPEIKINIVDFTEKISNQSYDEDHLVKRILTLNSSRGALGSIAMRLEEDDENKLTTLGTNTNVGHIFGIEKPMLFLKNNKLFFYFTDTAFESMLMTRASEENRAEAFYWAPDFPELTMEQLYQVGLYFKMNPDKLWLLNNENLSIADVNISYGLQQSLLKDILYGDTWDNSKFQVNKPNLDRSDWYSWIYNSAELYTLTTAHHRAMLSIASSLEEKFLINTDKTPLLKPYRSKLIYLMDL